MPATRRSFRPWFGLGAQSAAPSRDGGGIARATDLGLNRLSLTLVGTQVAALVPLVALYSGSNLTIAWPTAWTQVLCVGVIGAVWLHFFVNPGRNRREWVVAESLAVLLLVISLTLILGSGQYIVALLRRPLIDPALAAGDWYFGVSVPVLVGWTRQHEWLTIALRLAYFTLLPQFVLAIAGVGGMLPRGCSRPNARSRSTASNR